MSHGFQMVNKTYHLLCPVASLTIFFTSFIETSLIGCLVTGLRNSFRHFLKRFSEQVEISVSIKLFHYKLVHHLGVLQAQVTARAPPCQDNCY